VEDQVDLELGQESLQDGGVEDRAGDLTLDQRREAPVQRIDVEGDEGSRRGPGQAGDESVSDFAAGSRDENDRFPHGAIIPGRASRQQDAMQE